MNAHEDDASVSDDGISALAEAPSPSPTKVPSLNLAELMSKAPSVPTFGKSSLTSTGPLLNVKTAAGNDKPLYSADMFKPKPEVVIPPHVAIGGHEDDSSSSSSAVASSATTTTTTTTSPAVAVSSSDKAKLKWRAFDNFKHERTEKGETKETISEAWKAMSKDAKQAYEPKEYATKALAWPADKYAAAAAAHEAEAEARRKKAEEKKKSKDSDEAGAEKKATTTKKKKKADDDDEDEEMKDFIVDDDEIDVDDDDDDEDPVPKKAPGLKTKKKKAFYLNVDDDDNDDDDEEEEEDDVQPLKKLKKKSSVPAAAPAAAAAAAASSSSKSSFLKGVVLCISGIGNPERTELRELCMRLGGSYRPNMTKDVTHLIAADSDTDKVAQAVSAGKHIVTKQWLTRSAKRGTKLKENLFALPQEVELDDEDDEEDDDDDDSD